MAAHPCIAGISDLIRDSLGINQQGSIAAGSDTEVLIRALQAAHHRTEHDFGHHVLPSLLHTHRLFANDFSTNRVPGVKPYEERGYWRDIGSIEAYFAAHQDLLGMEPRFDLFNPRWPIYSRNYQGPGAKLYNSFIHNSVLAAGSIIKRATVRNSVIHREVILEEGTALTDCIIMDYVVIKRGARLQRVIVDRYNTVEAGAAIGYDLESDRQRYHVTPSGIVVVPEAVRQADDLLFRSLHTRVTQSAYPFWRVAPNRTVHIWMYPVLVSGI